MPPPNSKTSPEAEAMKQLDKVTTPPAFVRDEAWLSTLVQQAQTQRFHGSLEVLFEKGVVVRVKRNQSILPPHREEEG